MADKLDLCRVHSSKRLIDGMWALERSGAEIALVVDDEGRLVGTLTDGDARRALLKGATVESPLAPHMERSFTSVDLGTRRCEVIELMQARRINQVPVVDDRGRLVALHLIQELIGCAERPNWAVIMAGGKGTRLRPITEQVPKPMIHVAGRPILERIVLQMVGYGIRRVFLAINYLGHVVQEHFGNGERFGCRIDYLKESQPLGTGGALSLLPELPSDPVMVMNGDLVTQADLGALLEFHHHGGYQASVGVRRYTYTVPFGCIQVCGHRVIEITEKPEIVRMINAGIYILQPELVARVPKDQEFLLTTLIEQTVGRGEPVGAFEILDDWIDVGEREQLKVARDGSS